jgi:hypothetical protein
MLGGCIVAILAAVIVPPAAHAAVGEHHAGIAGSQCKGGDRGEAKNGNRGQGIDGGAISDLSECIGSPAGDASGRAADAIVESADSEGDGVTDSEDGCGKMVFDGRGVAQLTGGGAPAMNVRWPFGRRYGRIRCC